MRRIFYLLALIFLYLLPVVGMDAPSKAQLSEQSVFQNQCPICLEPVHPEQSFAQCLNKHAIHSSCVIEQMAATYSEGKNSTCPLCRADCEQQWVDGLRKPQLNELLQKLKEKGKELNNQLVAERQENNLLRAQAAGAPFGGLILAELHQRVVEAQVDSLFAAEVLRHTKKRMELGTWRSQNQSQLNGARSTWGYFYWVATGLNYISPFWTSFMVNGVPDDWQKKISGVAYWGSMRTFLTQAPVLMIGALYFDIAQYRLNKQEIEKRISLARELRFSDLPPRLEEFKRIYTSRVKREQIIGPLVVMGACAAVPLAIGAYQYCGGESVDAAYVAKLSLAAGVYGGYVQQAFKANENQKWFEENKPKFGPGFSSSIILPDGSSFEREHVFDPDMPI